jgi:NDP-4-keto-2,6-dideoxyhexose 3-C-methyltransferase
MFYDLESPIDYVKEIAGMFAPDGIRVLDQSYMRLMLEKGSCDTICHEHFEYYGLRQIDWPSERTGLKIADVEFNEMNGGSFSVLAALKGPPPTDDGGMVDRTLAEEVQKQPLRLGPDEAFVTHINESRESLSAILAAARSEGPRACRLGASTKGNVILQYCGLHASDIDEIGDVNLDKFGALTPGTWIPIKSEAKILASEPDSICLSPHGISAII